MTHSEAVGRLPSGGDRVTGSCWASHTGPHSLKKHWARAEGNNNLMLTVAWTGLRRPPTSEATHTQADGWEW